jgi:hypothetical protein
MAISAQLRGNPKDDLGSRAASSAASSWRRSRLLRPSVSGSIPPTTDSAQRSQASKTSGAPLSTPEQNYITAVAAAGRPVRAPCCASAICRDGVVGRGGLGSALAPLALLESVAVTIHLQDVDMMGQSIEQRAGQTFGGEHARPLVERQVAGDDGRATLVALAEHLEQQLSAGLRQRHVPEPITSSL